MNELDKRKKHCVLFFSESHYDACNCFVDKLEESFSKMGYNCHLIDSRIISNDEQMIKITELNCKYDIDFVFSINGYTTLIYDEPISLIEYFGIKHYSYLVDSPAYLLKSVKYYSYSDNAYIAFADIEHCNMFNKFSEFRVPCEFLPQGGFSARCDLKSFADRSIDVFFCGTYRDFNKIYANLEEKLSPSMMKFANSIFDIMLEQTYKSFDQALNEVLNSYNLKLDYADYLNFFSHLVNVDVLIRSMRRTEAVKTLADSGINVACYGSNWNESILSVNKNVKLMPNINFYDYIDLMADSKVVLNVLPNYSNGAHERIFSAMLNGSVCATDSTIYLRSIFKHGEDIIFYEHDKLNILAENVKKVINNEQLFNNITSSAKTIAERDHTWDNRAERILRFINHSNLP